MTIEARQVSPMGASYRTPLGAFGPGAVADDFYVINMYDTFGAPGAGQLE